MSKLASKATPSMIAGEPASPAQAGRRATSAEKIKFTATRDAVYQYIQP